MILVLALTACGRKARVSAPSRPPLPPVAGGDRTGVPAPRSPEVPEKARGEMTGIASYYAEPYHGRATANGEIFDTNELTAAHRTLTFNTLVRVINKANGHEVDVRINDRGPFIDGRVIDLSREAARRIDMIRSGTAPVELRVIRQGELTQADLRMPVYAVQVGAFESESSAEDLRKSLEQKYTPVSVERAPGKRVYRVRVGRETDILAAHKLARRIRTENEIEGVVVRANDQ